MMPRACTTTPGSARSAANHGTASIVLTTFTSDLVSTAALYTSPRPTTTPRRTPTMLSEEYLKSKINLCKLTISKYPDEYKEYRDLAKLHLEVYETALLGLQVKEGVKDAREVAFQIEREAIAQVNDPGYELNYDKASELIAAFALKQRGEEP
jgi:hypothetical protein